jgi:molybdenum cofactor synthesis domain-containing protein
MAGRQPRVAVVIIGDEVLAGEVTENNGVFLTREIARIGARLMRLSVIPDDEEVIAREIRALSRSMDAVLTTGGIGITHDDVTRQAVARAFGLPIRTDRAALAAIRDYYGPGGLNKWRRKLAEFPTPCRLIPNPAGSAPGFAVGNVYVFPGVPKMLRAMFPLVAAEFAGVPRTKREILTRLSESAFAGRLTRIARESDGVDIGSYPLFDGDYRTRLVIKSDDPGAAEAVASRVQRMLAGLGDDGAD